MDLLPRPKVASLLKHTQAQFAETREWFLNTFGKQSVVAPDVTPAESAVVVAGFQITCKAMEANGRHIPLPTSAVDSDFHFVLAFNFLVLREILAAIAGELDIQDKMAELSVRSTSMLLQMRPIEELKALHRRAVDVCSQLERSELINVKEFLSGIRVTTTLFLTELSVDSPDHQTRPVEPLFASQLQTMLSAAKP